MLNPLKDYLSSFRSQADEVTTYDLRTALSIRTETIDSNYYQSVLTDGLIYKLAAENDSMELTKLKRTFQYIPHFSTSKLLDFQKHDWFRRFLSRYWTEELYELLMAKEKMTYDNCLDEEKQQRFRNRADILAKKRPDLLRTHGHLFNFNTRIPESFMVLDSAKNPQNISTLMTGKYTILYFWGTWCGPCIRISRIVLPKIDSLIGGNKQLQMITIANENRGNIEEWLEDVRKEKDRYQNYVAVSHTDKGWSGFAINPILQNLNIFLFPNFMLVDPAGKILLRNDINGDCLITILQGLRLIEN